jgi:hypothetical protein
MKKTYGLIAAFDSTPGLYHACEQVRDAGFTQWDAISPFPVHGLEAAMGIRRSKVPRISICGGITGFCTGMFMIWFVDSYDYPLIVGGKPFFSPMFAFPVSYELTILFTAFATIIGMFILNGLPMHYHPVQKAPQLTRLLDDRLHIVIEARDPKFNAAATREFLARIGGQDIAELEE